MTEGGDGREWEEEIEVGLEEINLEEINLEERQQAPIMFAPVVNNQQLMVRLEELPVLKARRILSQDDYKIQFLKTKLNEAIKIRTEHYGELVRLEREEKQEIKEQARREKIMKKRQDRGFKRKLNNIDDSLEPEEGQCEFVDKQKVRCINDAKREWAGKEYCPTHHKHLITAASMGARMQ
eukprot:TRINITY_DN26937_c0_g1_i1.p1 TRINITY_DN26937_c0_g1~~TRINITY_DN26937_c0_g1_i1.p1  ORF type:complete len:181 (-),score=43.79 TRINITY_DN26937_c0_g1_i1:146-688(-)